MKHWSFLFAGMIAMVFMLSISQTSFAQESTATEATTEIANEFTSGLTAQDKELLIELIRATRKDTNQNTDPNAPTSKAKLSWQELTDKYLDKMFETGSRLLARAEEVFTKNAPKLWGVLIKQQIISAITDIVVPLIFVLLLIIWGVVWRFHEFDDENWKAGMVWWGPAIVAIVVLLYWLYHLGDAIKMLYNPEYHAISQIVEYISKMF